MEPDDLRRRTTPDGLSPLLAALWHEARGDWERAHEIAQGQETRDGDWVHAYLHRREGDLANADYWYRRAGRTRPDPASSAEWDAIVRALAG